MKKNRPPQPRKGRPSRSPQGRSKGPQKGPSSFGEKRGGPKRFKKSPSSFQPGPEKKRPSGSRFKKKGSFDRKGKPPRFQKDKPGFPKQEPFQSLPSAPPPPPSSPAEDVIYGRRPVWEALESEGGQTINKLWLVKGVQGKIIQDIVRAAREQKIVFQWVDRQRMGQLTGEAVHQGVAARVSAFDYGNLDDLLARENLSPLVLLDEIQDPHNVGAIVRSAAFFGAKAVVVPRWRSAGLSAAVLKSSAGAMNRVPLVQVTNVAQTLLDLKKKGYWIYGAEKEGLPCRSLSLAGPLALVIGSEGRGLRRLVRERCDELIGIPGSGKMESLNASCAAAVLLHEVFSQKMSSAR